jgi:hypothetical protein
MKKFIFVFFMVLFCRLGLAENSHYPFDADKERDPLRSLVSERGQTLIKEDKEVGDFSLQGILYSEKNSQAIINNQICSVGDVVDGYKVKTITASQVILDKNGLEFTLKWEVEK